MWLYPHVKKGKGKTAVVGTVEELVSNTGLGSSRTSLNNEVRGENSLFHVFKYQVGSYDQINMAEQH
jgi:hypothetical protein